MSILINRESITKLEPCRDRMNNYVQHYADREFTPRQFMGLKHITHQDKLWVAFRCLDHKSITLCAADIAASVLSIYEGKYPDDRRPREAIDAARDYANGKITLDELLIKRNAANAANAAANAANAAANAAAYAAANAAYAAANAANAAAYAAAYAAYAAYAADVKQEKLCRTIILKYWK